MNARWLALLTLFTLAMACGGSGNRTVYADVPAVGSLKTGAPVRFRGIAVGVVQKVTLMHSGVRLELLIQRPDAPLQADDHVALRPDGIFGDEVVEIIPGRAASPPLRDRDSLRAAAPDSLAPMREALARAAMRELTERFSLSDSITSGKQAPPASRP